MASENTKGFFLSFFTTLGTVAIVLVAQFGGKYIDWLVPVVNPPAPAPAPVLVPDKVPAADTAIKGPEKIEVGKLAKFTTQRGDSRAWSVLRIVGNNSETIEWEQSESGKTIFAPTEKQCKLIVTLAWTTSKITYIEQRVVEVLGSQPPPEPNPFDPPTPTPGPNLPGLRVTILYESSELNTLPMSQVNAIHSVNVLKWLTEHCTKLSGKPACRILDKDADAANDDKYFVDILKQPIGKLPWIVIDNGTKHYAGELPKTEAEIIALLNAQGGAK